MLAAELGAFPALHEQLALRGSWARIPTAHSPFLCCPASIGVQSSLHSPAKTTWILAGWKNL